MDKKKTSVIGFVLEVVSLVLIILGIGFRFYNMHWDSGALLHPDEYGLTNTLTQLHMPSSVSDYFNTRIAPMSPYNKYDINGETIANGPDNTMRWGQLPMLIIRTTAEALNQTGYQELRTLGRYLSAIMDVGSILILFVIGLKLFDRRTALLGSGLFSLCVQSIQQSHFMTVDNFAVFFTMLTLLSAVSIAQGNYLKRDENGVYKMNRSGWFAMMRFGLFLGMTICCKVNLAMLGLVLAPAVFISFADMKLSSRKDFGRIITLAAASALTAIAVMVLACRLFQPMMFRAKTGNTSFFTFALNPDWVRSMNVAATESSGIGGGPPSEQWSHRPAFFFAWENQVLWGMGLPLGLAVWVFLIMGWVFIFRSKEKDLWKKLLLPLFWTTLFFLFMSTRFVKNNRYFLPVYPSFCLAAAWGLICCYRRSGKTFSRVLCCLTGVVIIGGTLVWSGSFMKTVYGQKHSRVEAVEWIYDNIPSLFQLADMEEDVLISTVSIPADESETLTHDNTVTKHFRPYQDTNVNTLRIPKARLLSGGPDEETVTLVIEICSEENGSVCVSHTEQNVTVGAKETSLEIPLRKTVLKANNHYSLSVRVKEGSDLYLRRIVIANENWDEGLPFRMRGLDPFGQLYTGVTNEVRWYDVQDKVDMFMRVLPQADYLILPSQRGIWSVCRIPKTYPMTMAYYQALFDGSLGFKLVGEYQRPIKIGPYYISDLAGTVSTDYPKLPVVNLSSWAAEEAFSIYDHPPVWIFEKTSDFSEEKLREFLESFDLSQVVIQGPKDAEWE
ncbi:MAG: phospholipid carrier-dependent glycosyltransferase [Anaerolineaceae bacterium]|nr:phospholipid carrier-dependent glycosyltransferase [Anaerolineaceae bacterium]